MRLTNRVVINEVIKKTQAKLFKDVQGGDILRFEYPLSGSYHSSPQVLVVNETSGEERWVYSSTAGETITKFRYTKI